MDMMVVSKLHRRSQHGVVESGVKHYSYLRKHITFINLECISLKMLFRGSYLFDGVPHSVLITGAPGVGKTTLLKTFVCEWVNGKIYQRFSFVFFFRFQELNTMGKVSLETMILQLYPYLEDRLPSILKYPEKILFIFDGLEESIHQIDFISPKFCTNVSQVENMGTIVVSLVGQSLMKGCFVLMTMETSRVKRRHTTAFTQVAEIMGFSPKNKKLYFHRYFKKKAFSDQVFSYVKDIGALYNFCFIPNFCWMVCEVFSMRFTQETINPQDFSLLPKTLTQLLAGFVSKILSNRKQDKSHNRKLLASIGWMAGYGISNEIFAFDEQVLATFGIDSTSELLHQFMLETNPPPNVTFRFLHPFMPEFLAALVHYINYSPEKLYNSLEKANTYKYCCDEVFISFLCGLSNKSTRSVLRPYLGKLSSKSITRVVKYVSAWLIQQSNAEVHKLEEFRNNQRRCLTMFYYLYEARDKHLVREALGSCRRLNLSSVSLTPLDCTALAFILESCKDVEELDLGSCKFHEEYLRKFAPLLHDLKDLRLSSVMMTNDGVQFICPALINPESKIQTLWLGFNKLTDLSCIYLASAIRNNTSLRMLDLSWNDLSGPHFSDLMDVLSSPTCRIEELWLDHAGLIETSAIQLASGIRNNRSLRKLNLSRNFLNGPHFQGLMKALSSPTCRIEELELCEIDLTDEYAPLLKTLSKNISLTHLDLSNNKMSDASGRHLKELILKSRLKEISIYLNRMMSREMRQNLRNLRVERPGLAVYMDG
ncbi:hypothetical protein GDO81_014846 [Engystomops pustulosus]|uniref:NACHT domain-containing protein n=2 Tax=Engystomops pustulosus TaxID=76066 RepID=A0AAV7AJN8_ENGPU|nr:hypothetical protein GDO81_014846 [Engystomops pustulosus]